jgi:hypothetical protein
MVSKPLSLSQAQALELPEELPSAHVLVTTGGLRTCDTVFVLLL